MLHRGRVLDRQGHPVEGALIGVEWGTAPVPEIALVSDADGRFALDLPAGRFRIWVHAPDGRRTVLEVAGGGGEEIIAQL
jgi:hypothetical protein